MYTQPNTVDLRPVLRAGCAAYVQLDLNAGGFVPCKVLRVRGTPGRPSSGALVDVKITGRTPGTLRYVRCGEVIRDLWSIYVRPRSAVRQGTTGARVLPYVVETSEALP